MLTYTLPQFPFIVHYIFYLRVKTALHFFFRDVGFFSFPKFQILLHVNISKSTIYKKKYGYIIVVVSIQQNDKFCKYQIIGHGSHERYSKENLFSTTKIYTWTWIQYSIKHFISKNYLEMHTITPSHWYSNTHPYIGFKMPIP